MGIYEKQTSVEYKRKIKIVIKKNHNKKRTLPLNQAGKKPQEERKIAGRQKAGKYKKGKNMNNS